MKLYIKPTLRFHNLSPFVMTEPVSIPVDDTKKVPAGEVEAKESHFTYSWGDSWNPTGEEDE